MDFPPDWEVLPAEDFTTAVPRNAGSCGMELLAQIRPNSRILDHFRITLGGSKILDISVPLPSLLLGTPAQVRGVASQHQDQEEHDHQTVARHHRAPGLQEGSCP